MSGIRFLNRLRRRKHFADEELTNTNLARVLSLVDLTALGIGSTLGAGAYVLAGTVAKQNAGPAVVISYLIAAIASMLAGLCYAEFGARVPKAGSAYVYIYVTVAEIAAFIIGWDLILEYVIGSASVARAASGYFDKLIGDKLVPWFSHNLPMSGDVLAPYADLLAFAIVMVLTVILSCGVKESALVNKVFTGMNLFVLLFIIIIGCFKDDARNWRLSAEEVAEGCANATATTNSTGNSTDECGTGGFAPFGFNGVITGAAKCFYAYIGFDVIATTGEEAKNPQKNIPLATVTSLTLIFLIYSGISVTITMMAPYYLLDPNAPFAVIFNNVGWEISKYIISVGSLFALTTSLLGAMFPMPRVILAMGRDGLVFRFLGRVERRVKTPVIATLLSGAFAAIMATIFNTDALADMMSIGTLMAYTLVAACVLLLRYEPQGEEWKVDPNRPAIAHMSHVDPIILLANPRWIFYPPENTPSIFSAVLVKCLTLFLAIILIAIALMLKFATVYLFQNADWWAILIFVVLIVIALAILGIIWRQPQSSAKLNFKVPGLPFFPAVSMLVNIYLMVNLDPFTWMRFAVWMAVGMVMYFGYGIWHSSEGLIRTDQVLGNYEINIRPVAGEIFDKGVPYPPYPMPPSAPAMEYPEMHGSGSGYGSGSGFNNEIYEEKRVTYYL